MMLLFVDGILRIILSFHLKPVTGWGWMPVGGIVSALFAVFMHPGEPEEREPALQGRLAAGGPVEEIVGRAWPEDATIDVGRQ